MKFTTKTELIEQAIKDGACDIGLKEIAKLHDGLVYLFNALKHNDENEHSEKIDKAISLLNEVATDLICHCYVPKVAIPIRQNKCEKCGKRLHIATGIN